MMSQPRYSLKYEAHQQNLSAGLTSLQQNGEFVDMTLAADGHLVKVHKMVMSLASPYLKDIISSAEGQHPVIFLNKVSFTTLTSLLEYIYMGQAFVSPEDFESFIDAGRELNIRGLRDIETQQYSVLKKEKPDYGTSVSDKENLKIYNQSYSTDRDDNDGHDSAGDYLVETLEDMETTEIQSQEHFESDNQTIVQDIQIKGSTSAKSNEENIKGKIQYSLSNCGSVQAIFNRYLFTLNYIHRDGLTRHWRCIEHRQKKCPATITTLSDVVTKRKMAHNHPFHDKQLLKKIKKNIVFATVSEMQEQLKMRQKDIAVSEDSE